MKYIITDLDNAAEAAQRAADGDTLSVHPRDGGRPGLYEVIDHPENQRELRHVRGTPATLWATDLEHKGGLDS